MNKKYLRKAIMAIILLLLLNIALAESPANESITSNSTPLISWDVADTPLINYTLEIDTDSSCTSPFFTQTDIEDTNYTLSPGDLSGDGTYYWQIDGTAQNDTGIYWFTLDTNPPSINSYYPANLSYTNHSPINIEIETDTADECRYSDDPGDNWAAKNVMAQNTNNFTASVTLTAPGINSYYIQCEDAAGNNIQVNYSLNLDSTLPAPGSVTINSGDNYDTSQTFDISWAGFADNIAIEYYYYNFSNNSGTRTATQVDSSTTTATVTNTNEGNITFHVWAEDTAENIGNSASDWIIADYTNPEFTNWQTEPSILRYSTPGEFNISFQLNEANPGNLPECRYKIGANPYNSWQNSVHESGSTYSFEISEDWQANSGQTVYYQCRATDAAGLSNTSSEMSEYIVKNDNLPEFVDLEDQAGIEGINLSFVIKGRDLDGDDLTFSSDIDDIVITQKNTTAAYVSWIPDNSEVGNNLVNFTVDDGKNTTTESINIMVNGSNDAPVISEIENMNGYLHEPFSMTFTATDPDNENSAAIDDQFVGIFTADKNWLEEGEEIRSMFNSTNNKYVGLLNFTPLLSHKGRHNITIKVTDEGSLSDKESFILNIGYCGDTDAAGEPKCDSDYEDCETCPEDCGKCNVEDTDAMAIVTPDRNCLYTNVTLSAYKLYERATCKEEGRIINGKEVCEEIDGATIILYRLVDDDWEKSKELVTDTNGKVSFVPEEEGSYKLVGEFKSYRRANKFIELRECIDVSRNKTNETENKETEDTENKPDEEEDEKTAKEEEPSEIEDQEEIKEASTLEIILYFIIIPVLFASLIFVLFIYYQREKNNQPWILKSRIWLLKKKKELIALTIQYWHKLREKAGY